MAWFACEARCLRRTQRAILYGHNTPVTEAGSRLRAKPAPIGPGLDAARVEGSHGAMQDGEWRKTPPATITERENQTIKSGDHTQQVRLAAGRGQWARVRFARQPLGGLVRKLGVRTERAPFP